MFVETLKRDDVKAAIGAGDIKLAEKSVKISAKALKSQGIPADAVKAAGLTLNKDGDIEVAIQVPEAQNGKGMAALCAGKIQPATSKPTEGKDERTDEEKAIGVCDVFNYAVDLDVRAEVRQGIMAKLESPDKAIGKAVAALVAVGMPEAAAAEIVLKQMRDAGRVSADYTYTASA